MKPRQWCPACKARRVCDDFFPSSVGRPGRPCRECSNLRRRIWAAKRPDVVNRHAAIQAQKWRDNVPLYLWKRAKERAKKNALPFSITPDDLLVPTHCPVLGIPLSRQREQNRDCSPTVDRFIPERGYVVGNVAVISYRANSLKRDGTLSEFLRLTAWMAGYTIALDGDRRRAVTAKSGSELFANTVKHLDTSAA